MLGAFGRRLGGCCRQDERELLSAVPARDIAAAHLALKERAESTQQCVPGLMAVRVIDPLEVVDVEHDEP